MAKEKNTVLESCLAEARDLNALVDYAAESIVSKTILDKPVGTITLFAFDINQRLSEHTAPYHAVVQIVDGKGIFTIGGIDIEASAGQLLIMPADIPHAVFASQKFKMLLIMIRA
jgi:quercetin dioxygenase-like cupin family protein